jgi:hypothetical protein
VKPLFVRPLPSVLLRPGFGFEFWISSLNLQLFFWFRNELTVLLQSIFPVVERPSNSTDSQARTCST